MNKFSHVLCSPKYGSMKPWISSGQVYSIQTKQALSLFIKEDTNGNMELERLCLASHMRCPK